MSRRLNAFSRFLAAFPAIVGRAAPRRRRRLTDLADLPDSIRYDIGVTDTCPVVRGCPRQPQRY